MKSRWWTFYWSFAAAIAIALLAFYLDRFGALAWPFRLIDSVIWRDNWYISRDPRLYTLVSLEYWGGNILTWTLVLYLFVRLSLALRNALPTRRAGDA
jgi:hypothetical protein